MPPPVCRSTELVPLVTNEVMVQPEIAPAVQAQRSLTPSPLGLQAGTGTSIGSPLALRTVQVRRSSPDYPVENTSSR